ncbi:MAG: SHOCT domain-containing protein [Dehalococcoidia bacterium]|nr:SHOCT domain-containing protein [Dehalococcoidia bacterium]
MSIMMLIVWLPLLLLIGLAFRSFFTPGARSSPSAEEEARRAYARGDIDRDRFQQIMQDLREHRSTG